MRFCHGSSKYTTAGFREKELAAVFEPTTSRHYYRRGKSIRAKASGSYLRLNLINLTYNWGFLSFRSFQGFIFWDRCSLPMSLGFPRISQMTFHKKSFCPIVAPSVVDGITGPGWSPAAFFATMGSILPSSNVFTSDWTKLIINGVCKTFQPRCSPSSSSRSRSRRQSPSSTRSSFHSTTRWDMGCSYCEAARL